MPHSSVSKISNRCRALRFSETSRSSGSFCFPPAFLSDLAISFLERSDKLTAKIKTQARPNAMVRKYHCATTFACSELFFRQLIAPSSYILCLDFASPGAVAKFPPPRRLLPPYPRRKGMADSVQPSSSGLAPEFPVHIHLLGVVDFEDCLSLQRRLAYDALTRGDGRIVVLICKHPPIITIGRSGSRADVKLTGAELVHRDLELRYV